MGATVWPITEEFAAEIGDIDLSEPLTNDDWATIHEAYDHYSVLIFPGQNLEHDQHAAFAQRFGPIDPSMVVDIESAPIRIPTDIADVSNLTADNQIMADGDRMLEFQRGNRLWHTDSSFKTIPANASLLYIRSIPPVGGLTEFADMRAAFDALDDATRKHIEGRIAYHSIANSRARLGFEMTEAEKTTYPNIPQAMVRTRRSDGKKSLYIASHIGDIEGLTRDEAEALTERLLNFATQRQFVYTHRWREDDLVIWDNRCTLHRGRPFDDLRWPRDARRATSLDIANTCEQEGLTPVGQPAASAG